MLPVLVSLCFWLVPASTNVQAMTSPADVLGSSEPVLCSWVSVPWGVFGTGISQRYLCNPADWTVDELDVLPLKVLGFGPGNPKGESKVSRGSHCGSILRTLLLQISLPHQTLVVTEQQLD